MFSEKCLGYGGAWAVEGPERVRKAADVLRKSGYEFLEPEAASEDAVLLAHDMDYVWAVKKSLVDDSDSPALENIFEFARLSAGGAIRAAEVGGFSLMRPPGHHAGTFGNALGAYTRGFCYFNNIAIAVKRLGKPALILDIDGHHGNGTQEIFFRDEKIIYISLHRHPNYPGTGTVLEENCLNFPLPADCGDEVHARALEKALGMVAVNRFEVVAVSAGFDTHAGDLASLGLTEKGYFGIGEKIAALKKPTFFVLEGGYRGEQVGKDIDQLLKGFEARV